MPPRTRCNVVPHPDRSRDHQHGRPIEEPADLQGLKIRVPGNTLWTDSSALGASPTTMAFSEVFTGLQTGTINGQENPIEVPWTNKFYEVQNYLSMTDHINDALVLALRKQWDTLDDAQKKVLTDAAARPPRSRPAPTTSRRRSAGDSKARA